ncbi:MAG: outer membrane protein assembly factor BamD [Acidobacteria bacterium]|nr:outer membrane protein assembly factor BamD [Acidobacteriota bacterium]MCW5969994.1 outer membrane protein assembly factor BamD [Blastocatellales bacterium]
MHWRSLGICLLGLAILSAACGGAKDKVANEAVPGRDKELYEEAMTKLRKGRYDESRLMLNVVISSYPDSEYLPLAKLAIADSFYREGGSTALEQAIGGYKDFAQYFPTHPLNCQVKLKIAHAYMRQMNAFNRDASKARQAEFQLQATLQTCRNSPIQDEVAENLKQVQQVLGLHELDIARFYFNNRQAYKSAEGRLTDIVKNYPYFTYRDEALYLLGVSRIEQEQPEEAATAFSDLVRNIPNSEFTPKAKEYLEKLGKPIPEPVNNDAAPERPGMMGRVGLILGRNDLTISKDGVLISSDGDEKEEAVQTRQRPEDAAGPASAVRARVVNPNTPQDAGETGTNGSAPAAKTESTGEVKKDEKKDEKKNNKKKKKGFLGGILR